MMFPIEVVHVKTTLIINYEEFIGHHSDPNRGLHMAYDALHIIQLNEYIL